MESAFCRDELGEIFCEQILTTKDTHLRWFQFRILHKLSSTGRYLYFRNSNVWFLQPWRRNITSFILGVSSCPAPVEPASRAGGAPTKLLQPFHSFLTCSFCLLTLSTIFHSKNSPQYLRFQLPSYSLFLPNRPFSCIYLQHNSSSYTSYSLRSPSDPACLSCAASRVGGGWDPGGWGPPTSAPRLRPRLPLDGWLGWPDPINRLVVLCLNFD